jgi:tetratricopeptide (TPR) repeat protein
VDDAVDGAWRDGRAVARSVGGNVVGPSGGQFPDDEEPRPDPLPVPESAPEWSPAELERYLHVVAMEAHTKHAVRRDELMDALHAHVAGVGNPNPLLLMGPAGCGKSTALATLVSEIQAGAGARNAPAGSSSPGGSPLPTVTALAGVDDPSNPPEPEPFVLAHTFGLLGQSDDFRRVLLRLCSELKARFNIYVDLPSTLDEIATAFPRFLAHAALFGKIIVLLDGLDRADMRGIEQDDWLPSAIPLAARVIIASSGCRAANAMRDRSGTLFKVLTVPPLTPHERGRVIEAALADVGGGRLSAGLLEPALAPPDAGLPFFLFLAAQEIRATMRETGDVYQAAEDANAAPGTLVDALSAAFDRLERRYGTTLVAEATTLLGCSRAGLREDEVLDALTRTPSLANMPPTEWSSLRGELEPYCWPVDRLPGEPALCFFQPMFRAAAMRRYADEAPERRAQHLRVAAMFADPTLEPSHRNVAEVLWGLREGHDWNALRAHLTDPRVHALLWNEDTQIELADHWEALLRGEQHLANARNAKLVPGPGGAMVPPPPRRPRRRRDVVAEYELVAESTPPSADGVLVPEVYRELLADFLAWSGHPGEAAHVLRALSEAKGDAADLAAVSVNYKLGRALGRQGLHMEAEETLRRALAAEQLLVGAETPMVAEIVTELCKLKMEEGDVEQAGQLAAHAVTVWEAAEAAGYEEADVDTLVKALVRLAEACEMLDRSTAAEAAYERSLERLEYMLGPDHPEVAEHLGKMAGAYSNHGEWEKAEFCYCRALAFAHRFTGPASLHVSHFYNVLAELHRAQGDLPHAQALYQRALQVIESVLGANHPEVATYLNNLAELLRAQGNLEEAEPMYKRALAIDESAQGVSHPIIAIRLNNLAELFRDMGRMEDAEPMYQRALAVDMAALGENHPNVATYLNNLAGLYKSRQMWDKAAEHYTRAIAIDERALGPDHPDVAIYLNNLAGLYKAQGRLAEAEPLYLRALRINENALGADHADMAIYFNNIALLYKTQGKLVDARLYYEQAIDIGEKTLGNDHPQLATRLTNLGSLLMEMEDLAGAEDAFARALTIRRETLGPDAEETRACQAWMEEIAELRDEQLRARPGMLPHRRAQGPTPPDGTEPPTPTHETGDDRVHPPKTTKVETPKTTKVETPTTTEVETPTPGVVSLSPAAVATRTPAAGTPAAVPTLPAAPTPPPPGFPTPASPVGPLPGAPTPPTASTAAAAASSPTPFAPSPSSPPEPTPAAKSAPPAVSAASASASAGSLGVTPRTALEMSQNTRTSGDAVDAALSSVDAMLAQYTSGPLEVEPSPPKPPWELPRASATPPAIFMSGATPAARSREPTPPRAPAFSESPGGTSPVPGAGPGPNMGSSASPGRSRPRESWERDGDVSSAPGLAEASLDAFLSAHVEYLGNRQYRCVLDGKILSKFSIMRVHVAKNYAGLVHQWAKDQSAGIAATTAANAGESEPGAAPPSAPPGSVPPPAASPERNARLLPSEMAQLPTDATSAHSQALKRVEELEEELARLRGMMAPGVGPGTVPRSGAGPDPGPGPGHPGDPGHPGQGPPATPFGADGVTPAPDRGGHPGAPPSTAPGTIPVATPVYPPYGATPGVPPTAGPGAPWDAFRPPSAPAPFFPYSAYGGAHYPATMPSGAPPPGTGYLAPIGTRGAGGYRGDETPGAGPAAAAAAAESARLGSRAGLDLASLGGLAEERRARGENFAEMLARERGADPFRAYRPSAGFDGPALSPAGSARGGAGFARARIGDAAARRLARHADAEFDDVAELPGVGRVDRLGLYMAARSQQVARRKFLCELDGKVFSTMNLMRVHFERHYAADADAWWHKQMRSDPAWGQKIEDGY